MHKQNDEIHTSIEYKRQKAKKHKCDFEFVLMDLYYVIKVHITFYLSDMVYFYRPHPYRSINKDDISLTETILECHLKTIQIFFRDEFENVVVVIVL